MSDRRVGRRRGRGPRARAALLCGLALFLAQQVGLAVAVALWLPGLRDPHYAQKVGRLRRRLGAAPCPPLAVVMVGSSRTAFGVRAGALEAPLSRACGRPVVAINFGLIGAGPVTELLTLRRLLHDGLRPGLLLVEVLPPLLAGQVPLYEAQERRLPTCSLRASDLPLVEAYGGRPLLRRDWCRSCLLPWYHHRLALLSRTAPRLLALDDRLNAYDGAGADGWMPAHGGPDLRRRALAHAQCDCGRYLRGFRLGGPAVEGLEEVLATCRREHIPAALVVMPEGPLFRSWYPAGVWPQVQEFLDQLRRRYGVPVVNAREWMPEEAFADSHHLLPPGAAAFTERLGREAIAPLLAPPQRAGR